MSTATTQSPLASDAAKPQDGEPPQGAAGGDAAAAGETNSVSTSTSIAAAPPPPASPASAAPLQDTSPAPAPAQAQAPRPQFTGSPSYVVPPPSPSFSYSVLPRPPPVGGGAAAQQPASAPAMKLTPPMPAGALQPPVPGQYLGNRPSFSYNVVSHANASLPTGQQFQLNTAANHAVQIPKFVSPASLQPPVPGQLARPNAAFPGAIAPSPLGPVRLPFTMPSKPSNLPFSVSSQSQQAPSQPSYVPSNAGNLGGTSKSDAPSAMEASSQPMQLPTSLPPNSSAPVPNASGNPSPPISMPTNPSLPPRPAVFGAVGSSVPGQPSSTILSATPSLPGRPTVPSTGPLSQTSPLVATPIPAPQNAQQHFYPSYPSASGMVLPQQHLWAHPPPVSSFQHAPFQPYQAGPLGAFARPFAVSAPAAMSSPNIQPSGVSTGGEPKEPASTNPGPDQPKNTLVEEPPSAEHESRDSDRQQERRSMNTQDSDAWSAHKTEAGVVYYYNAFTGESTYQRPPGFKGEPEKVTTQSVPVSWDKLSGTDWSMVTTSDGKKYYYDNKSKVSSWQLPPEVAELKKNTECDSLKGSSNSLQDNGIAGEKGATNIDTSTPALLTGGRDSLPLRQTVTTASSSALDLIKKKLQDAGASSEPSTLPASPSGVSELNGSKAADTGPKGEQVSNNGDKSKDAIGDGNMSDSSSDSDDEGHGPSKEECIRQFKDMLKERGVAPFSKWEKELPKIVFDPRFKAVPSHSARRAIFDHYVRTRAEEERKEKRAAQKAAVEAFKQLLEEASEGINHKTDYQEFKRKWGSDPRFNALDRKERETLFNEKVKAAEEKVQSMRNAVITSFKSMLRESKDVTSNSRWSKVKENFRSDPRYKAVKHEEREIFFNEYITELKSAEDEAERAAKAKMDEQAKLREREREMRKRKEREEQEMERVKLKIRRKEAISSYQALLVEMIKDPQASWTESKPKLDKDPQGRATNPDLSQGDVEKLFRDHVKDLYERCTRDFRALLSEVITPEAAARKTDEGRSVINSWSEAKRLLKPDPRYAKLASKEKETFWRRHADDMARKLKQSDAKDKPDQRSSDPPRRR